MVTGQKLLRWHEAALELDPELATASQAVLEAAGRRLRDAVIAAEAQQGKRIATRLAGRRHPKTRITMGALARHMPELRRSKVDQLADNFRGYLRDIDERIAEGAAEEVQRLVEPRIRELRETDEQLQRELNALAERVALIAKKRPL
jgi:DNA anti-recombination protein RmuC